jgi:hypothetical protein
LRESQFTASLRTELKASLYVLKIANAYYRGVPDCYYSGSRDDLWSEHKYFSKLPPTIDLTNEKVTTRLQQIWLVSRHAEGRNVGMIIGSAEGHLFLPGLEWQRAIPRDEFRSRAKNKKQLAAELIELLGPIEGPILP